MIAIVSKFVILIIAIITKLMKNISYVLFPPRQKYIKITRIHFGRMPLIIILITIQLITSCLDSKMLNTPMVMIETIANT